MYTLGINAAYHDSSACRVDDGIVLAAAEQEERFTQIEHGKRPVPFAAYELPHHAIDYCLGAAGIELNDVGAYPSSFRRMSGPSCSRAASTTSFARISARPISRSSSSMTARRARQASPTTR